LVATAGTKMLALDRATGEMAWGPIKLDMTQGAQIWSSPQVVDDKILLGIGSFQVFEAMSDTARGSIVGLALDSGDLLWQTFTTKGDETEGSGVSVWSSTALDTKLHLLYIGTGQTYHSPASPLADSLVALDYGTGELKWSTQFTKDDIFTSTMSAGGDDFDVGAAPNLFTAGGKDLVGVGDKGGHYYVLDRATGDMIWERKLTVGSNNGGVMASAAVAKGVIYVASNQGDSGRTGGASAGPMKQTTFALDAADGTVKWQHDLTPATYGALSIANGVLYVPTIDGALWALDADTGEPLFKKVQGMSGASGPVISNGMVFVGNGWQWVPMGKQVGGLTAYGLGDDGTTDNELDQ
jgi:polyvinyl alcohol dehydrogenase (cytochrome)